MFSRFQFMLGLAVLFSALTSVSAYAKGGFDFISITGADLDEEVRITESALTQDFFTFANFYEDRTKVPTDPGEGYEILRYYVDGTREIAFDRLHYYPETGYVFYDGIENGESEYDGEWYTANPEIKAIFESALSAQLALASPGEKQEPITSVSEPENSVAQSRTLSSLLIMIVLAASGITVLLLLAFRRRNPFTR